MWEFLDARIVTPGFYVLTSDKILVAGGYSFSRNWHQPRNRVLTGESSASIGSVEYISGGVIVGGIASHYGHAFVDLIDRLISLNEVDRTRYKYLALHGPFDSNCIELLHRVVPWAMNHEVIDCSSTSFHADRVLLPENLSEKPYWASTTVEAIQKAMNDVASRNVVERKILYISRRKASQRTLINEKYLLDRLQVVGFNVEVLIPEESTLQKQIDSFKRASTVIGVIGSALFNIAFTRSSLKNVFCLVDKSYLSMKGDNIQMLRSLGTLVDCEVLFIACDPSTSGYDSDLSVGEAAVASLIKSM